MENHNLILGVSHLLSSSFASCRFRALADVFDSSIISVQTNENESSSFTKNPEETLENDGFSGPNPSRKNEAINLHNRSSPSHSGWFSSADEKFPENDAFFSFSSCSGEYFLPRDRRTNGERTSSSKLSASISAKIMGSIRRMPEPPPPQTTDDILHETADKLTGTTTNEKNHDQLGSDKMSAKIYYSRRTAYSGSSRRQATRTRRRAQMRKSFGGGSMVGECLAVEKKSRDPRRDFQASMVDMILAKQLFGEEDLERLLICFLSLNNVRYHGLIFEVFSEICETLFRF